MEDGNVQRILTSENKSDRKIAERVGAFFPEDFICLEQELFSYINGVKDSAAKYILQPIYHKSKIL